jgi:hypothetical protein
VKGIPRIKKVEALKDMCLMVEFDNSVLKKYDVKPLSDKYETFADLKNRHLFNAVKVDCGGFGISWNDEIDLSEYEIWNNGVSHN